MKTLSDAEQSWLIEQIQKKVKQFQRAESGAPYSTAVVADLPSLSEKDNDDEENSGFKGISKMNILLSSIIELRFSKWTL